MNVQKLAKIRILRSLIFPILRRFDFSIVIFHDLTKRIFFLKFWSHKGYWFYGSKRESFEINNFKKLISKSYKVIEVGAHIGYLTQFFENLVSSNGEVLVIEPSPINRKFLQKNINKKTLILPIALSDKSGNEKFYIDEYGGFTNSLKQNFTTSKNNELQETQFTKNTKVKYIQVEVSTIDEICNKHKFYPDFIKIDVEGAELEVLKGAKNILRSIRSIMIEISNNHEQIFDLLKIFDFMPLDDHGNILKWSRVDRDKLNKNFFFIKKK